MQRKIGVYAWNDWDLTTLPASRYAASRRLLFVWKPSERWSYDALNLLRGESAHNKSESFESGNWTTFDGLQSVLWNKKHSKVKEFVLHASLNWWSN
jgi:hypothetical protein